MYRVEYEQDGRWLAWDREFETERAAQALIDWIDIPTIKYRIVERPSKPAEPSGDPDPV